MIASIGIVALTIGVLLLLWACSVRRSLVDGGLIFLSAMGALAFGARVFVSLPRMYPVLEGLLGIFGVVMFIWSFCTPLGSGHRLAYRLSGCAMLMPLLAIIAALTAIAALYSQRG